MELFPNFTYTTLALWMACFVSLDVGNCLSQKWRQIISVQDHGTPGMLIALLKKISPYELGTISTSLITVYEVATSNLIITHSIL